MDTGTDPEHQDLLQFLYQCPVGVISMDAEGRVSIINPAASRLLTPELIGDESVVEPLPVLRRLAPQLFATLDAEPDRLGVISNGRGVVIDSVDGRTRFSISVHRIRHDNVFVSLSDVTEERRILDEHRARAHRLQRALLGSIDTTDLELSVAYHPAHLDDLAGGDWYDVIQVDPGRYALVVGDVVGHDIEASATMGQLRAVVRALASVAADPDDVLRRTEAMARTIDTARCATLNYLTLDTGTGEIRYSSAGHPPPLILHRDGSTELLTGGRRPALAVGVDATGGPATANLASDDILLLFTDGLVERRGESIDDGLDRLRATATDLSGVETIDAFAAALTSRMLFGTTQRDDVCLLALRHR